MEVGRRARSRQERYVEGFTVKSRKSLAGGGGDGGGAVGVSGWAGVGAKVEGGVGLRMGALRAAVAAEVEAVLPLMPGGVVELASSTCAPEEVVTPLRQCAQDSNPSRAPCCQGPGGLGGNSVGVSSLSALAGSPQFLLDNVSAPVESLRGAPMLLQTRRASG